MFSATPEQIRQNLFLQNAEKSLALASALFPGEEWVLAEPNIWAAKSRLSEKYREPGKWAKEIAQVRILTGRGSIAYFLPEKALPNGSRKRSADLVMDGVIVEMKMSGGTRTTLGSEFKHGYRQGAALAKQVSDIPEHLVFIRGLSDLRPGNVKAKIAGELKNRTDRGSFICYFEHTGELYHWTYEELKAIIGT